MPDPDDDLTPEQDRVVVAVAFGVLLVLAVLARVFGW